VLAFVAFAAEFIAIKNDRIKKLIEQNKRQQEDLIQQHQQNVEINERLEATIYEQQAVIEEQQEVINEMNKARQGNAKELISREKTAAELTEICLIIQDCVPESTVVNTSTAAATRTVAEVHSYDEDDNQLSVQIDDYLNSLPKTQRSFVFGGHHDG